MEADKEIWKDVDGYEGLYKVSSYGNVLSLKYCGSNRKHLLAPNPDHKGYLMVYLSKRGKRKTFKVHRLVASAFIPNPHNLPQVNHKDENKQNNHADNLEWCDSAYNVNYGTANNRRVETIELNTKSWMVVQSRGVCNSNTDKHDEIINLVRQNIGLFKQKSNGSKKKTASA